MSSGGVVPSESGSTLMQVGGELIAKKAIGAALDYTLDFSPGFAPDEEIVNSVWSSAPNDLTISNTSYDEATATVRLSGGIAAMWYTVVATVTSTTGEIYTGSFSLNVFDPANVGVGLILPFPSSAAAVAQLRRDRLATMLTTFLPGVVLDDGYLLNKIAAATADLEHRLRVYLTPREILPNNADQSEIDALTNAGNNVVLETPLDYEGNLFVGTTFGRIETRSRPIIAVHSIQFNYPTPNSTLYTIPGQWVRIDRKYGIINLVPINNPVALPLNAFILSALGGGNDVPEMLSIRYRAGIENVARDWPDLLDIIMKSAALGIVEDNFVPSSKSESVSADGLSQSTNIGLTMQNYAEIVDRKIASASRALFGITAITL